MDNTILICYNKRGSIFTTSKEIIVEVVLWSVFVVVLIVALALASTIDWDAIVEYFAAPDERGEFAEHDKGDNYRRK